MLLGALPQRARRGALPASAVSSASGREERLVIIDPGHGGEDGGAVSAGGIQESQINLAVSLRLEQLFRLLGVPAEMTRRTDVMVCGDGCSTLRQRKVSDLQNRVKLVNETPNAILLSIHQNSLPSSPETHGAQVFWNAQPGAESLAQELQTDSQRGGEHGTGKRKPGKSRRAFIS